MMESLEDRRLMHGTLDGTTFTYLGTNAADRITVTLEGLSIVFRDATQNFTQTVGVDRVKQIVIEGFGGNDQITVKVKKLVQLDGGEGNDTLRSAGAKDELLGGAGNDQLDAGGGNDALKGDEGNDLLRGGGGNDGLRGGDGKDTLDGGTGADELAGDIGADYADYRSRKRAVTVTVGAGNPNDGEANEQDNVLGDVENVFGSSAADRITGNAKSNRIEGRGGNDTLLGGGRNDTLFGSDGDDSLLGDAGRDQLLGGAGDDRLDGNAGPDTLSGEGGNDALFGKDGDKDFLHGGEGTDNAEFDSLDLRAAIP